MLAPAPGSLQIDATLGGGGHTERILEATHPDGRLLGLDADASGRRQSRRAPAASLRRSPRPAPGELPRTRRPWRPDAGFGAVDGCLFDLGLSSFQLADRDRGFGFRAGGPLDMRFDTSPRRPGGRAPRDARRRRADRALPPLRRGAEGGRGSPGRSSRRAQVAPIRPPRSWPRSIERVLPAEPSPAAPDPPGHPRLPGAADRGQRGARGARGGPRTPPLTCCDPGGRLVVLSYHSLEDRIVKRFIAGRAAWLRLPA